LIIIVGYSFLSYNFFFRGMDNIVSANMERALQAHLSGMGNYDDEYIVTDSWYAQPAEVQKMLSNPKQLGKLYIYKDTPLFFRPNKIIFLIKLVSHNNTYFISRIGPSKKASKSKLVGKNLLKNWQLLVVISFSISLLLFSVIWLLIHKISRPITELKQWTKTFSAENLTVPLPDFDYKELNEMASLIRNSFNTTQETLEREQQFLRFTSHELRTPISIIRNNVELVHKLESMEKLNKAEKIYEVIERIDRASHTMQHLTETLLWLSRDNQQALPTQNCDLKPLIESVIDDLRYLLNNKPVTINQHLEHTELMISTNAARIVLSNLIRNAFQHTWKGYVHITQEKNHILIINHCEEFNTDNETNELGFGLGLRLTTELCRKLDWLYDNRIVKNGHEVVIQIGKLT